MSRILSSKLRSRAEQDRVLPRYMKARGLLTPAERRVGSYLMLGYSNKEIAVVLGKAEATVKHQVQAIMKKLRVGTRSRAVFRLCQQAVARGESLSDAA